MHSRASRAIQRSGIDMFYPQLNGEELQDSTARFETTYALGGVLRGMEFVEKLHIRLAI